MLSRSLASFTKRAASTVPRASTESVTKLDNGLTVASIEQHGATSQLLVAFRAGSRFENPDNQGVVHLLRNAIGSDTANNWGGSLVWGAGNAGADLLASTTRDLFAVQSAVIRDNVDIHIGLLGELANPQCEAWMLENATDTVPLDKTYMCPVAATLEGIHLAAFRTSPLGKASFVGKKVPSWKTIQNFKQEYFRFGNAVIVGINVDHTQLVEGAAAIRLSEGAPAAGPSSKYYGGEIRVQHDGPSTYVSLAGEGSALSDYAAVAAQAVASQLIHSTISKTTQGASPLNASYSDGGLLGITFSAEHAKIGQLTKSVHSTLKNLKADDKAVEVAKAKASLQVLTASENTSSLALDQATQLLSHGSTISPQEFSELINKVSAPDVNKALSKVTSKLSISSFGNITSVPYLDEL